jgi:hypothetical protein
MAFNEGPAFVFSVSPERTGLLPRQPPQLIRIRLGLVLSSGGGLTILLSSPLRSPTPPPPPSYPAIAVALVDIRYQQPQPLQGEADPILQHSASKKTSASMLAGGCLRLAQETSRRISGGLTGLQLIWPFWHSEQALSASSRPAHTRMGSFCQRCVHPLQGSPAVDFISCLAQSPRKKEFSSPVRTPRIRCWQLLTGF